MQINHNISALIANGHLKNTNNALDKSIERLSSGYRINHAADDAAGMAISKKMKTQIAGLEQSSRNASDGISVIQTAEGALGEVQAMLQRARELAVQAANDTNTAEDREAIQQEIDQLKAEINRISTDTEFNTKSLLDGSVDRKSYSSSTSVSLISVSDAVDSDSYELTVTAAGVPASVTGSEIIDANKGDITNTEVGSIIINGEAVEVEEGDSYEEVIEKIRVTCNRLNIELSIEDVVDQNGQKTGEMLNFRTMEAGADQSITIYYENEELADKFGLKEDQNTGTGIASGETVVGQDAEITLDGDSFSPTATVIADGNIVKITDSDGFEMKISIDENIAAGTPVTLAVLDAGPMKLQIGANEGQTINISIPEVSVETLGLAHMNVLTHDGSQEAISMLDDAINAVSGVRSKLGAYQNRLEHAVANLDTSAENLTEALSRIEDVDMAEEMSNYTQKNVLAQAGVSMVSQANERPQTILSLLQ